MKKMKYGLSCRLFAVLFAVLTVLSVTAIGSAAKPEIIENKDTVTIQIKASSGSTRGEGDITENGSITSIKSENTLTIKAYNHTNPANALYLSYSVNGGAETVFDSDTATYIYKGKSDETVVLTVKAYAVSSGRLMHEITCELKYEKLNFFESLYWSIIGNDTVKEVLDITKKEVPRAIWDTFYVTVLSTLFAVIIGLPLGVLLVVGDKNGILPLPKWIMRVLNIVINLLRSIPFLILMIMVIPISRLVVGTSVGTVASIIPLVFAAFPFVARLVETSLREVSPNIIEAAQSMGASPFKIIVKVMIPESVPSLISNVTIAVTTILGYSAMSAAIGGGGLGKIAINYGYHRYNYAAMMVAVILLIVMVQVFQSLGTFLAKKFDRRLK